MPTRSGRPDITYHPVTENPSDFSNEAEIPVGIRSVSTFELEVINAFGLETSRRSSNPSERPGRHNSDASEKSLLARVDTTENVQNKSFLGKVAAPIWTTVKKPFAFGAKLKARMFPGWRGGIVFNAALAGVVLLINIVMLVWAIAKSGLTNYGLITIFSGDCTTSSRLSTVAHLFINILSTLLLGASNYAMQISSSPLRSDVDEAHKKQESLDIGVLSLRNLRRISKYRLLTYILLLSSSIPLHFLYNSVISQQLATLFYGIPVFLVTSEYFTSPPSAYTPPPTSAFLNGTAFQYATTFDQEMDYSIAFSAAVSELLATRVRLNATHGQLKQVGVSECWQIQYSSFQNDYQSMVFVYGNDTPKGNSSLIGMVYYEPGVFQLQGAIWEQTQLNLTTPTDCWVALSEGVDCELFFNANLMIGVILANVVKFVVLVLMVLKFTKQSLVTIGDGIASFLMVKDPTTVGIYNTGGHGFHRSRWIFQGDAGYKSKRQRWGSSPSPLQWGFSMAICTILIASIAILLWLGINGISGFLVWQAIWYFGFGKPSTAQQGLIVTLPNQSYTHFPPSDNPLKLALLANVPQFLLSIVYVLINNLLTGMLGAREWNKIGRVRTKLRTTIPRGEQRSTYFLQLPYKYSLSLMILMGGLHYLASQSLFVVYSISYVLNTDGNLYHASELDDGWLLEYSVLPIIFVLPVSILLVLLPIVLAFRKLEPGIPMVGSYSALISAACHPPFEESDAGLLPVQWGAVESDLETGVAHCSISSGKVSAPIEGQLYQ